MSARARNCVVPHPTPARYFGLRNYFPEKGAGDRDTDAAQHNDHAGATGTSIGGANSNSNNGASAQHTPSPPWNSRQANYAAMWKPHEQEKYEHYYRQLQQRQQELKQQQSFQQVQFGAPR